MCWLGTYGTFYYDEINDKGYGAVIGAKDLTQVEYGCEWVCTNFPTHRSCERAYAPSLCSIGTQNSNRVN